MIKFLTKLNIVAWTVVVFLAAQTFFVASIAAQTGPFFQGGNILTATNNTKQAPGFSDPLTNVDPGNVVQFRVDVLNNGDATANGVVVSANMPSGSASTQTPSITISSSNAASVSDIVTVSGPTAFQFGGLVPSDTLVFSPSCPSGCLLPDTILSGGVNLGDVLPVSQSNNVGITFKVFTVSVAAPTPTPTPTTAPSPTATPTPTPPVPTATPTPTPIGPTATPTPTSTPTPTAAPTATPTPAPAGAINITTGAVTQTTGAVTQTQTQTQTQSAPPAAAGAQPAVAGISTAKQLPKTGLPLLAWAAAAFLPVGFRLRRFNRVKGTTETPEYIWQNREYRRES